ncbi:MAG: hypothetical protein H6Q18_407 [Bacteroidetes bacterium]|nr:hypothetical protein [Bacteroidota bacterium]
MHKKTYKKKSVGFGLQESIPLYPNFAESVRFELTEQLPAHRFSRPTRSTTLATFLIDCAKVEFFLQISVYFERIICKMSKIKPGDLSKS